MMRRKIPREYKHYLKMKFCDDFNLTCQNDNISLFFYLFGGIGLYNGIPHFISLLSFIVSFIMIVLWCWLGDRGWGIGIVLLYII
jgi:hypothetical protein